ncbi:MAG: hypothetical protein QF506_04120 [Candidatus Woesearchaeota archaeon]|nr:hypothetical protein [Candidatus Woesearchaeota archaeon]
MRSLTELTLAEALKLRKGHELIYQKGDSDYKLKGGGSYIVEKILPSISSESIKKFYVKTLKDCLNMYGSFYPDQTKLGLPISELLDTKCFDKSIITLVDSARIVVVGEYENGKSIERNHPGFDYHCFKRA